MKIKQDYKYLCNPIRTNGFTAVGLILRNTLFVLLLIGLITIDLDKLIG